jgi:hypothetical protein
MVHIARAPCSHTVVGERMSRDDDPMLRFARAESVLTEQETVEEEKTLLSLPAKRTFTAPSAGRRAVSWLTRLLSVIVSNLKPISFSSSPCLAPNLAWNVSDVAHQRT